MLDIVYTEKVREEEGGTYGVSTGGSIARYPEGQTLLQILFDTDPDTERMEQLNEIILNELKRIAANGPKKRLHEGEGVPQQELQREPEGEQLLAGILSTKYFYGEDNHSSYIETVNAITPQRSKRLPRSCRSGQREDGDHGTGNEGITYPVEIRSSRNSFPSNTLARRDIVFRSNTLAVAIVFRATLAHRGITKQAWLCIWLITKSEPHRFA